MRSQVDIVRLLSQLANFLQLHHYRDLAARNVLVTGQGVAKVIAPSFRRDYFSPRWPILVWRGISKEEIITERCFNFLSVKDYAVNRPYFSLLATGGGGEAASAVDES